jgi:hypothetical protein
MGWTLTTSNIHDPAGVFHNIVVITDSEFDRRKVWILEGDSPWRVVAQNSETSTRATRGEYYLLINPSSTLHPVILPRSLEKTTPLHFRSSRVLRALSRPRGEQSPRPRPLTRWPRAALALRPT